MNTQGQGSLCISLNNHIISEMSCTAPSEIHQRNSHPCIYSSCPSPALRPFGSQSTWVWLGTIYLVSMDRIWWVLIICNFQLKKSSLLLNANKIKSSCLDADSNYKKLMRPSGHLNLSKEHGLRDQNPCFGWAAASSISKEWHRWLQKAQAKKKRGLGELRVEEKGMANGL